MPLNVRPCAIKLRDTTDQFIWESPKTGLPCNPTHFRDVFRKSLEEAGDVRLLTLHSCRHTYVSQMQALGVDIQTIQSIVGHADTEMTEHYLHVQGIHSAECDPVVQRGVFGLKIGRNDTNGDQIKPLALWSKLWSKPNEVGPQTKKSNDF